MELGHESEPGYRTVFHIVSCETIPCDNSLFPLPNQGKGNVNFPLPLRQGVRVRGVFGSMTEKDKHKRNLNGEKIFV